MHEFRRFHNDIYSSNHDNDQGFNWHLSHQIWYLFQAPKIRCRDENVVKSWHNVLCGQTFAALLGALNKPLKEEILASFHLTESIESRGPCFSEWKYDRGDSGWGTSLAGHLITG